MKYFYKQIFESNVYLVQLYYILNFIAIVQFVCFVFQSMSGCGSGIGMLRSRRRDANVKPNRVLDRNSSRGMIYENEELRLRTININAEIERG